MEVEGGALSRIWSPFSGFSTARRATKTGVQLTEMPHLPPYIRPLDHSVPEDAALTCAGDELANMPRNVASPRGVRCLSACNLISGYENPERAREWAGLAFTHDAHDFAAQRSTIARKHR
ncbi:hypothetical protein TARUN_9434 [Trichoderma arundinaceum]|uniref:Uncharacterized protein n=1 Tax=Trichoderma arundinaceum TaxID=490622 RepID=A0A395N9N2_TRIAR|nr:hypothetical protein TARUN_9434 [Trichoderma arundinaceum]